MNFKAIRGTNDHIPEDMAAWNFVESEFLKYCAMALYVLTFSKARETRRANLKFLSMHKMFF